MSVVISTRYNVAAALIVTGLGTFATHWSIKWRYAGTCSRLTVLYNYLL